MIEEVVLKDEMGSGVVVSEIEQALDDLRRARELAAVYEAAVVMASEALNEHEPELSPARWFEVLRSAALRMRSEDVVSGGRWVFFSDGELEVFAQAGPLSEGLRAEIESERVKRQSERREVADA